MKERYIECTGRFFIREVKKHWWSRWKIDKDGVMPIIYYLVCSGDERKEAYIPYYNKLMAEKLATLGWADKGDVLVRYSNPRLGWKPADGTLIIGYHEYPKKVNTIEELKKIIEL